MEELKSSLSTSGLLGGACFAAPPKPSLGATGSREIDAAAPTEVQQTYAESITGEINVGQIVLSHTLSLGHASSAEQGEHNLSRTGPCEF